MTQATRVTLNAFRTITAILVAIGVYFLVGSLLSVSPISQLNDAESPYTSYFYVAYSLANLVFLSLLGVAGYRLFNHMSTGIDLLSLTLKSELAYWVITSLFWFLPAPFGMSAAGATGIGNMGIAPQILIAYPISGLVVLWLLKISNVLILEPAHS